MAYKPLDEKTYRKFLKMAGWDFTKGKIDYKLLDENGIYVCTIQISHSKRGKQEVTAYSVQKQNVNLNLEVGHGHQKRNKTASKNSFKRCW